MSGCNWSIEELDLYPERLEPGEPIIPYIRKETRRRLAVTRAMRNSGAVQATIFERCKEDFQFWADNFAWTWEPRSKAKEWKKRPMVFFDYQRDFANYWVGDGEEYRNAHGDLWALVVDKSRDMGVTWELVHLMLWEWQFHHESFGIIARLQKDVDDGTNVPDSIMGRIRWACRQQPISLRPPGFRTQRRLKAKDKLLMMVNGDAVIRGSATVDDAFRSKRMRRVVIDEANMIRNLGRMLESITDVCEAPVAVSSVRGRSTDFARLAHGEIAKVCRPGERGLGYLRFTFHYSKHPLKDPTTELGQRWMKAAKAQRSEVAWAQEQEIDYMASLPGRCWPECKRNLLVYSHKEWRKVDPWLDHRSVVWVEAWDFGAGPSPTTVLWGAYFKSQGRLFLVDYRSWRNPLIEKVVHDVGGAGFFTMKTPGRVPDHRIGDPSGSFKGHRIVGGVPQNVQFSWFDNLRANGISVHPQPLNPYSAIQNVRALFKDRRIVFSPACAIRWDAELPSLVESCEQYHWRLREGTSEIDYTGGTPKPEKDAASHLADCVQMAAARIFGVVAGSQIEQKRWDNEEDADGYQPDQSRLWVDSGGKRA